MTREQAINLIQVHCANEGQDFIELESYSATEIEYIMDVGNGPESTIVYI